MSGKYTNHASGIANDAGVSIRVADDKKGLIVETKKKGNGAAHKPATSVNTVHLTGAPRQVVRSVASLVHSYQPSLKASAKRRASQLLRSINPRKLSGKNRRNKSTA